MNKQINSETIKEKKQKREIERNNGRKGRERKGRSKERKRYDY